MFSCRTKLENCGEGRKRAVSSIGARVQGQARGAYVVVLEVRAQDAPTELAHVGNDEAVNKKGCSREDVKERNAYLVPSSVHAIKCADFGSLIILRVVCR